MPPTVAPRRSAVRPSGGGLAPAPASDAGRARGVEAVERALDLLEALEGEEIGLVDLARRTGLTPSTAHRLLATLSQRGYVRRHPVSQRYVLGGRPLELGNRVARGFAPLAEVLAPYGRRIHRLTEAPSHLFVLQGHHVVCVAQYPDPESLECLFCAVGDHIPAYATAAGKAILAHSDATALAAAAPSDDAGRLTPRTIVARDAFVRELDAVRRAGYAVSRAEYVAWITAVAAPIFDERGIVGAISSSATARDWRRRASSWQELGELIGDAAREASSDLGWTCTPAAG